MHFSLRISNGKLAGREIPIRGPRFLIGCADDCHLKIPATQVSLYHCALLVQDDDIWVRNYGSGVSVGGVRVVDRRRLNNGDEVQVGLVRFEMVIEGTPAKRNEKLPQETKRPEAPQSAEAPVAPMPELSDLSKAPLVSPDVQTAPATPEDFGEVDRRRLEEQEPASEVANDTLMQFYTCRNAHDDRVAAPAIAPKPKKASWWTLVEPDGDVNPNVMFVLGILVGIGLSTAANTFWMISGQPADMAPAAMAPTATAPAATVDDGALATVDEDEETPPDE
jgi:hypothetical protein